MEKKINGSRDNLLLSLNLNIEDSCTDQFSREQINEIREKLLNDSPPKIEQHENPRRLSVGPSVPSWLTDRPFLSLNFIMPEKISDLIGPLGEVATTTQEQQLLDDILNLMIGCQGMYISASSNHDSSLPSFTVDSSIEPSLKELVNRILPLCRYYSQVVSFIEDKSLYHHGTVNHALSSAMRNLLKDYLLLVTQLESQYLQGTLTLHRLWFYIENTLTLMEMLAGVITSLRHAKCHGGKVLTVLHDKTLSLTGCNQLQDVLIYLTEAASIPYIKMLSLWIYRGVIVDLYKEFMVIDNEENKDDDIDCTVFTAQTDMVDEYWDKRYAVILENIPTFLLSQTDMIFRTGKYLNVIRESDSYVASVAKDDLSYSFRDNKYSDVIEKNYAFASKQLLQLLLKEKDLMAKLRYIKHYFLLDQGDFVVQLLLLCEDELSKNIDSVVPTRLKSLLELCLRTASETSECSKDDIQCTLLPYSLRSQMFKILSIETNEERTDLYPPKELHLTGYQSFTLTYNVEWPLSLVIDNKSIFCYQLIFRHLFYCKYVESLLCRVWVSNKEAKSFPLSSSTTYTQAFALRQRMINFMQNLQYYMNFEVIERHWLIFINKMNKVENIEEVLNFHSKFIKGCLKDCMLTSPELLRIVCKLTSICVSFANFILCMRKYCDDAELDSWSLNGDREVGDDYEAPGLSTPHEESPTFEQTITKLDFEFTEKLLTLMDRIVEMGKEKKYNDALIHLLYRLDFNNYYSQKSENVSSSFSPLNSADGAGLSSG